METGEPGNVSRLLLAWKDGDEAALERLMPLVYAELHRIASRHLRDEHAPDVLQTTALVHEAYIRLVGSDVSWEGRRHFFAIASRTMRRVLVDQARARQRSKRGGGVVAVTLRDDLHVDPESEKGLDVLAIDEALERLAEFDERKARIIELHYFGGLTYEDVAKVLEISPATVHRELRTARSWLYSQLNPDPS
jgi:RNA polymerase sigma factor (TIGR02999 family)